MFVLLSQNLSLFVWLFVYGLCIAGTVLAGAMWVRPRLLDNTWSRRLLRATAVVFALVAAADGVEQLAVFPTAFDAEAAKFATPLLAAFVGAAVILLLRSPGLPFLHRNCGAISTYCATYVMLGVLMTGYTGVRFHYMANWNADADSPHTLERATPGRIEADAYAVTDRGHRLELFRYDFGDATEASSHLPESLLARVIRLPNKWKAHANCHGWIFTSGHYVVSSDDVDAILHDNAYQRVHRPQPGDLIIYRDALGFPVHTGLVKATGDQGYVLIASKWGPLDTYLHAPEDQVYSERFEYYRSSRSNHLLVVCEESQPSPTGCDPGKLANGSCNQRLTAVRFSATINSFDFGLRIPWRKPTGME